MHGRGSGSSLSPKRLSPGRSSDRGSYKKAPMTVANGYIAYQPLPFNHSTSNSPAAPMPPPTHIVTTTYFAPRRLPSISAWPVMRAPLMP